MRIFNIVAYIERKMADEISIGPVLTEKLGIFIFAFLADSTESKDCIHQ